MADKSPWYDRIAKDEDGQPVKMKYVGKHLKNAYDAVTEGTGKFVKGDFDGADEAYGKAKSRRVDIEKEQQADRPKYGKGGMVDPYGGDRTPGPSTLPKPDTKPASDKPKAYAGGGKVRGVGAAQRGFGRGKIC